MERENAMNNRMEIFDVIDDFYVGSETKVYRTLVLSTVKVKSFDTSELVSFIPRSPKYGATTDTLVVLRVVVLMIRVGLQPSATTGVLIPDPTSLANRSSCGDGL